MVTDGYHVANMPRHFFSEVERKLNFTKTEQIVPYVDQMFYLLGKTYDKLQTFVPIQEYQIDYYKNKFLKYINPGFIKCVTDENDELVAFAITMPSFSNALKKINGKVDFFGKLLNPN